MLQPNQFYPENTSFFNIIRYLGEGKTAYVYHALDQQGKHLALKVMHTDLNSDMQRMFKSEKNTLRQLSSYLSQFGEALTPRLYEDYDLSGVFGTNEFIAQELVTGEKIVNLAEIGETLSEKTGTIIVEKFALVLQVLHEDMHKTYSDMKYQNIWWLEDEQNIRVTDWNVIDDFTDEGLKRDLLKFATYAARIFVGQMPRTQGNLIVEDIRKNPGWEKLSFGIQHFLRKALHTNPKYRYQSAKEMRTDLLTLTQAWSMERNELVKALLDVLNIAESKGKDEYKEALLSYQKAKIFLEIAETNTSYRLRPADKEEYAHRISRGISGTDFIAIGLEFYASTDYKRALKNFEQGYEKGSGDIVLYRHWRDLGRMAIGVGEDFADFARTLHDAVKELNDENYSAAVRLFDVSSALDASMAQQINALKTERDTINIRETFERVSDFYPEFSLLYVEALAWERLRDADKHQGNEDYAEATALYAQALSLFSLLPEESKIFVPDIQAKEIEANRLANLGSAFADTITQAETEVRLGEIKAALPLYEEAYRKIVRNVDVPSLNPSDDILKLLWDSMLTQGEGLLQQGNYDAGKELFRLGASYYPDNDKFRLGVWQAEQLMQLTSQDIVNNPIKGFDTLNHTLNYVRDFSLLTVLKNILSQRLDIVLEQLTDMGEHVLAQRLVAGAKKADQEWWHDEGQERYLEIIQVKQTETEEQIRKLLTDMRREVSHLSQMGGQITDSNVNRLALEKQISRARTLVSELPNSSSADEFMREIRTVERGLIQSLPKPTATTEEETKALYAAEDALAEARGLLELAAQKTLRTSYSIWGNAPIRWYDFVAEIEELAQKAKDRLSKARINLATELTKPNVQASPLYTKLQAIDTQLAQQRTQLGNLTEEWQQKEEEKLYAFILETHDLLKTKNYSQAARILTRMTPLVEKHPELKKEYSTLERRYKRGKKEKFISKPVFWVTQASSFFVLLSLALFGLLSHNTPHITLLATETFTPTASPILSPTNTPSPVPLSTEISTEVPTLTPTAIPVPACDPASYPASLVYIGGEGQVTDISAKTGTVIWRYQNQGGCLLTGFAIPQGVNNYPTDSIFGNSVWYSNILTITHNYTGLARETTRELSYEINGDKTTIALPPITIPDDGTTEIKMPAGNAPLLEHYTSEPIIMSRVGDVEVLDSPDINGSTRKTILAWTITNNSNTPLTLVGFVNASDVSMGEVKLVKADGTEVQFSGYSLALGETVTIITQAKIGYSEGGLSLTRKLKVNNGIEDTEIVLAKDFDMYNNIETLPPYPVK
jgi:hypothetical protein